MDTFLEKFINMLKYADISKNIAVKSQKTFEKVKKKSKKSQK